MSTCQPIQTNQTILFTNTCKIQYTQQSLMKELFYIYEEEVKYYLELTNN